MLMRKNVIRAFGMLFLVLALTVGCNQNQGALPSDNPPSFEAWQQGNNQARIQTHNTNASQVYYRASWVLQAEKMLQSLGYMKQADSNYDNTTKAAVTKFQTDQKLRSTGWMDTTTYNRLTSVSKQKLQTQPNAPQTTKPANPEPTVPTPAPSPNTGVNAGTADENRIIELTNAERQRNGLSPLKVNSELTKQARIKAQDMVTNNYFSHTSPTFGSPFDQIRSADISYTSAGENIAGNRSTDEAFQAWMNSSGHRANILSNSFNQIGVGVVDGGPYGKMFVQMFIRQ